MQQCQDQLEFNIETPSDEELERRHARNVANLERLMGDNPELALPRHKPNRPAKKRNRKSKHTKKLERLNR